MVVVFYASMSHFQLYVYDCFQTIIGSACWDLESNTTLNPKAGNLTLGNSLLAVALHGMVVQTPLPKTHNTGNTMEKDNGHNYNTKTRASAVAKRMVIATMILKKQQF